MNMNDFEVKNGVLTRYHAKDGETAVVIPNGVTSIGEEAFSCCYKLKSITIPDSVTSIGKEAFFSCQSLESITIPNSVTSIGKEAFIYCSSLKSITIPDSVTKIGDGAFSDCKSLESITIPDSVTRIGDGAFSDCKSLESIIVSENNQNYADIDGVLYDKKLKMLIRCPAAKTSITIPDSVISIGDNAFECSILKSITIPDSVISIGDNAFEDSSLESITIPDSITRIGKNAFNGTKWLENYPDDFVIINGIMINYKGNAKAIAIPEGVVKINKGIIFSNADIVTFPNSLRNIDSHNFVYVADWEVYGCTITLYDVKIWLAALCSDYIMNSGHGWEDNEEYYYDEDDEELGDEDYGSAKPDLDDILSRIIRELNLILQREFDELEEYGYIDADEDEPDSENARLDMEDVYRIIVGMFHAHPDDEEIIAYISENIIKFLPYLFENATSETIQKMLDNGKIFTADNIDGCIKYMVDNKKHEMQVLLTNYKEEKIG